MKNEATTKRNEGNEAMATKITEAVLNAKVTGQTQVVLYHGSQEDLDAELGRTYLKRDLPAIKRLISVRLA